MKIVIAGNYGAKNLGDEMILEGVLKSLECLGESEITVLSADPTETEEAHKVRSVEKVPAGFKSFLNSKGAGRKAISECDYFILGGGGLFGSLTFRANIIWAIQAFTAQYYKKPVICLGQSVGKIKNILVKVMVKRIFQKAKLITVRDQDSKNNLQEIGVKQKIHVFPDPVFRTDKAPASERTNSVVVALRQMTNLSPNFKEIIQKFLNWLINKEKKELKFIDFQKGSEHDQKLHQAIQENVSGKNILDISEFSRADLIIGMRLHSILTAIKRETPFIAINYNSKVSSYLKDAGLIQYSIDLEDLTFEGLQSTYNKVKREHDEFTKKLRDYNLSTKSKFQELESLLKSSIVKQ